MLSGSSGSPGRRFPVLGLDDVPISVREAGAFLPDPLPDEVTLRPSTYRQLAATEGAITRLDEMVNRLPSRAALVHLTRLREVQATASLDGIHVPLRKVLILDLPGRAAPTADERLLRYLRADDRAVAAVLAEMPIDVALLNDISSTLTGAPEDGDVRWRTESTWLGGPNRDNAYQIAAPPGTELMDATKECCRWVESQNDMPVVGKLALAHFQLAVLAPFAGADHLARLYITLQLIRNGLLRDQILPISNWLTSQRDEYRAHLHGYIDGALDAWVNFIAVGIQEACHEQARLITELEQIRGNQLSPFVRKDYFLDAIGGLIGYPVTNHHQLARLHGINIDYAGELIARLLDEGLVVPLDRRSLLPKDDDKRYATVVSSPEILQVLSRYLPLPDDEDLDFLG